MRNKNTNMTKDTEGMLSEFVDNIINKKFADANSNLSLAVKGKVTKRVNSILKET